MSSVKKKNDSKFHSSTNGKNKNKTSGIIIIIYPGKYPTQTLES